MGTVIVIIFFFLLFIFVLSGIIAIPLCRLMRSYHQMSDEALQGLYKDVIEKRLKMNGTEYGVLLDEMECRGLKLSKDGYDVNSIEK